MQEHASFRLLLLLVALAGGCGTAADTILSATSRSLSNHMTTSSTPKNSAVAESPPPRSTSAFRTLSHTRCHGETSYDKLCGVLDGVDQCFYQNSNATLYRCATPDCSEGVPEELTSWCSRN